MILEIILFITPNAAPSSHASYIMTGIQPLDELLR